MSGASNRYDRIIPTLDMACIATSLSKNPQVSVVCKFAVGNRALSRQCTALASMVVACAFQLRQSGSDAYEQP